MTTTPAAASHRAPAIAKGDGSMVRVLVVDDEHSLTELLKMALRYEGWDVRTAGDGFSAVKVAREFRPDAIVAQGHLQELGQGVLVVDDEHSHHRAVALGDLRGAVLGHRRAAAHESSIRVALCVPYDFVVRMLDFVVRMLAA